MLQIFLRAKEKQRSWYLDNGCSRHKTGEKSIVAVIFGYQAIRLVLNLKFGIHHRSFIFQGEGEKKE